MPSVLEFRVTGPNTLSIKKIISSRKTSKILSKSPLQDEADRNVLESLVFAAAHAPFHYVAAASHRAKLTDHAPEPWRIYILHRDVCRAVRKWLIDRNDKTKVPEMLATADMVLQVTWCPTRLEETPEPEEDDRYDASLTNMEHIAATGAAIQNILLSATEEGVPNYWSSGGPLRTREAFMLLGIPRDEILLGSVFFFPRNIETNPEVTVFPGKMRERRSFGRSWCRRVEQLDTGSLGLADDDAEQGPES